MDRKELFEKHSYGITQTYSSRHPNMMTFENFKAALDEYHKSFPVELPVMVKLADILQILDDEEYTVSVYSNDTVDDKISESIANTAVIDFKRQLKEELLSKFSA